MRIFFRLLSSCLFILCFAQFSCAAEDNFGTVSGKLVQPDGKPQQDAIFFLFDTQTGPPPAPGKYFRFPDGVDFGDDEGRFELSLPAGEYWYGVINKPAEGKSITPDYSDWLYLSRSPEEGMLTLNVEAGKTAALGEIICESPLPEFILNAIKDVQLVGVISDQEKTPLANFVVELFGQGEKPSNALFTSGVTSENGQYSIRLAAGNYYLKLKVLSGRNINGYKNRSTEKYVIPKPKSLSFSGENQLVELDITVRDKSKGNR